MNTRESIPRFSPTGARGCGRVAVRRGFGNLACRELRAKGYRVYTIHPAATTLDATGCYSQIEDLPERVGAMLVPCRRRRRRRSARCGPRGIRTYGCSRALSRLRFEDLPRTGDDVVSASAS